MKNKEEEENLKIFKDGSDIVRAAMKLQSIPKITEKLSTVEDTSMINKALATQSDDWIKAKEAMEGRFTKKFLDIMDNLPPGEFMRTYLKYIEYFKPKVVRIPVSDDDSVDTTININILSINAAGETKTIDISEINEYDEEKKDETQ